MGHRKKIHPLKTSLILGNLEKCTGFKQKNMLWIRKEVLETQIKIIPIETL